MIIPSVRDCMAGLSNPEALLASFPRFVTVVLNCLTGLTIFHIPRGTIVGWLSSTSNPKDLLAFFPIIIPGVMNCLIHTTKLRLSLTGVVLIPNPMVVLSTITSVKTCTASLSSAACLLTFLACVITRALGCVNLVVCPLSLPCCLVIPSVEDCLAVLSNTQDLLASFPRVIAVVLDCLNLVACPLSPQL